MRKPNTHCSFNEIADANYSLESVIRRARAARHAPPVQYDTLLNLQKALRTKRKELLGTNIPLRRFLFPSADDLHPTTIELIDYLTEASIAFWGTSNKMHAHFCRQFYELCFAGDLGITIDDVILLASTRVHLGSGIYLYVAERLLPQEYHALARTFATDYPAEFYCAAFEDSVLAAVCALIGVLKYDAVEDDIHG